MIIALKAFISDYASFHVNKSMIFNAKKQKMTFLESYSRWTIEQSMKKINHVKDKGNSTGKMFKASFIKGDPLHIIMTLEYFHWF